MFVFCRLNSQLIFTMKCALGHPPPPRSPAPPTPLPRRKMARSVAACSIFKRRCNLPTIPDAAECRGWVLDRHIYLTERAREGGSQEGWSEKDEVHAMREKLRRQSKRHKWCYCQGFDPHHSERCNVYEYYGSCSAKAERRRDEQPSGQRWNTKWEMLK